MYASCASATWRTAFFKGDRMRGRKYVLSRILDIRFESHVGNPLRHRCHALAELVSNPRREPDWNRIPLDGVCCPWMQLTRKL